MNPHLRPATRWLTATAVAACLALPLTAQADDGLYIGAVGTMTKIKIDTTGMTSGTVTEGGLGGMAFVGGSVAELDGINRLDAEFGYISSSIGKLDGTFNTTSYGIVPGTEEFTISGFTASLLYRSVSGMFVKLGTASITLDDSVTVTGIGSATISTKSNPLIWGLGYDWMMGDSLGLRLEVGQLNGIKDSLGGKNNVNFYNAGIVLRL